MISKFPPYLAAIDRKRNRIFVLAIPDLCAIRIDGVWHRCQPLPDEEIVNYNLITNLVEIQKLIASAKKALEL
jgi:hypothetical protein